MNLVQNKTLHPYLRDEEALVVENAIRLAVDSIINVLYGVNSARTHEYQRMVADRDKEIQRLECRLKGIGQELQVLRRRRGGGVSGCTCTCGLFDPDPHGLGESQSSGFPLRDTGEQGGQEDQVCVESEGTGGQQECEMSISLGLFARPPSHVSSQSHESALPSSPSRTGLDQTCTSHSSESSRASEATRNLPTSPSSLVVKEEPCDMDTVLIKWEMSEERFTDYHESGGSPHQDRCKESTSVKKKMENIERIKCREKAQSDLDRHSITEVEQLRSKKKTVPMSALSEEAQTLKRAAWRAASRRYYARKIARQQANPSRPGPFPHFTDSRYSQPISFMSERSRTLVSELPKHSM